MLLDRIFHIGATAKETLLFTLRILRPVQASLCSADRAAFYQTIETFFAFRDNSEQTRAKR